MSSSSDTLRFSLPTHGDSLLSRMNVLREELRFCDITLTLGGPRGSTVQSLQFPGHRVVLAASSDFLRDQFLLHEGQAELSVGVVSSGKVAEALLVSCYTGLLEVPQTELVSYLTAASALQMSEVVEKCSQAISWYLSPTLAFLKLDRRSDEKEIPKLDSSWPSSSFENQKEKDAAQPSTAIQEAGAVAIQSKLMVSQEAKVDCRGLRKIREDREVVKAQLSKCCFDTLESEEGENNNPLLHLHHNAATLKCKRHHPAVFQNISFTGPLIRRTSAASEELVESSQNQHQQEVGELTDEENIYTPAAQLQHGGKQTDNLFYLSAAHLSESCVTSDEVAQDSDSTSVQRPYLCRRCDKVFQHLESYAGHLKEHRQYFCLVCGKGFSQKSNLTRHIRFHTGVKPFRCPLCHKTFTQKATLQDHLNLHTGDRPHKFNHSAVHLAHKSGLRCNLRDSHGESSLRNGLEEAVDLQ